MKQSRRALPYLIAAGVGLAMSAAVLWGCGGFAQPDTRTMYIVLSDAFFVPGIMLVGFGILMFVSYEGFFDSLSYSVRQVFTTVFFFFRKDERYPQYYDYKMKRAQRRKKPGHAVWITGVGFLLLAGVFTLLTEFGV